MSVVGGEVIFGHHSPGQSTSQELCRIQDRGLSAGFRVCEAQIYGVPTVTRGWGMWDARNLLALRLDWMSG